MTPPEGQRVTGVAAGEPAIPALEFEGVSRNFGSTRALDDVSFKVPKRSIFGLLGPNGAGKTTLFSIAAGFLRAHAGRIRILGHDHLDTEALLGRFTILPQDAQFQRNVPIMEQLIYFRRLEGRTRDQAEEEVRDVLDKVGLGEKAERGVQVLSHGMVKRLGVAQAFLGSPEVILLDEPTAGLDPHNALQVRNLVQSLTARECTVVISSHNLFEIEEICDHVAILDKGKVVRTGPVHEITRAGAFVNFELSRPAEPSEVQQLEAVDGVKSVSQNMPGHLTVELDSPDRTDEIVANLQRRFMDIGLTLQGMSRGHRLEDLFLELTDQPGEKKK